RANRQVASVMGDGGFAGEVQPEEDLPVRLPRRAVLADAAERSGQDLQVRQVPLDDVDVDVAPRERLDREQAAVAQAEQPGGAVRRGAGRGRQGGATRGPGPTGAAPRSRIRPTVRGDSCAGLVPPPLNARRGREG